MRPVISVKDNGTGIDPEALERFLSLLHHKNQSGIGCLSRQFSVSIKARLP
jgi:sensor histidine kinase YesM